MEYNITIIIITVAAFLAFLIIYLRYRDTPSNNLRRARKHHNLGRKYYDRGDLDEAQMHYDLAKQYREKAIKVRK